MAFLCHKETQDSEFQNSESSFFMFVLSNPCDLYSWMPLNSTPLITEIDHSNLWRVDIVLIGVVKSCDPVLSNSLWTPHNWIPRSIELIIGVYWPLKDIDLVLEDNGSGFALDDAAANRSAIGDSEYNMLKVIYWNNLFCFFFNISLENST